MFGPEQRAEIGSLGGPSEVGHEFAREELRVEGMTLMNAYGELHTSPLSGPLGPFLIRIVLNARYYANR